MKISLDLDGTILSHMTFFSEFMIAMKVQGHEIGILTARRTHHREATKLLLAAHSIPEPAFLIMRAYNSTMTYGEFKAQQILLNGIDMHFDDCNFGSIECEAAIRAGLGSQAYKLIKVTHRDPEITHEGDDV